MIDAQLKGHTIPSIARMCVAAQLLGQVTEDYLPTNKMIIQTGAAVSISSTIASMHERAELPNGKMVDVRKYVAPVRQEEDEADEIDASTDDGNNLLSPEEIAFVHYKSPEALARAYDYLITRVPGYAIGRLEIIAINGGNVREAVDDLIDKIEDAVKRLTKK